MTTWKLSPQHKKSAVEKMFFYKDGKTIVIEQGFRWATFTIDCEVMPLTLAELKNEHGYELGWVDLADESWEMVDMIDGCWLDIEAHSGDISEEEQAAFEEAWEEDSFEGVEALGWSQDDTEYYYYGPLALTNEETGKEFFGEEIEEAPTAPEMTVEEKVELVKELEAEVRAEQAQGAKWPFNPPAPEVEAEPEVTDWFPSDINPAYVGRYQIIAKESETWPFPSYADWDGKKWTEAVAQWRGLAQDPSL